VTGIVRQRTRLLLVRHGESTWNAVHRWQGQADPPLSPRGEQQARTAAASLAIHGVFDIVVTSSLQRSRRTGELLAHESGMELGVEITGLSERSAGPWEGLTRDEIERSHPGFLASGRRPAGYEDDLTLVARALAALSDLVDQHAGGHLLVVSHGGVINALERHTTADDVDPWKRLDNLEGRWFDHIEGRLHTVGQRVHLLADPDPVHQIERGYI
jgi:probable phosphoglycerate mutase